jgi:hypothetical protein
MRTGAERIAIADLIHENPWLNKRFAIWVSDPAGTA